MKLGKINFFKRMFLAITDFRMYPFTQKEKLGTAVAYFFKLILIISLVIGAFVSHKIFEKTPEFLNVYNELMPEYTVSGGVLTANEIVEKEINKDFYLIVNSDYTHNHLNDIEIKQEKNYDYYLYIVSDAVAFAMEGDNGMVEIGGVIFEPEMNFGKNDLYRECESLNNSPIYKIIIWLAVSLGIFVALLIIRLWNLVMYILSIYIINFMFGLKLKITEALRVAIYVGTLPLLLEVIAIIAVGAISETINFISVLLSCVYIFYALRALKLDSLILGGTGKTAEEKIKKALVHAQEELEKQLSELEKEENKKDANEEKQAIEDLGKELKEKEENLLKAQREYQEVIQKAMDINKKDDEKK